MMNWKIYEEKLKELRDYLEKSYTTNPDIEVHLISPDDKEFQHDKDIPYVLVRYYVDDDHFHERKMELFDYYLEKDIKEIVKMLTAMIEEFTMEIEQSEYGGG